MRMNIFVTNLEVFRKIAKLTQEDLANTIGVTRQTIGGIESGKVEISVTVYLALLFLFNELSKENKMLKAAMEAVNVDKLLNKAAQGHPFA